MTRRQYWTRQMDAAYEYMLAIQEYPVEERGERMVSLAEAAISAGVQVLFSTLKHVQGCDRIFFLREGIIPSFTAAARELNDRGWALKVEDGYRTRFMQKHLALKDDIFAKILNKVIWELEGRLPSRDLLLRRLAALIAMNPKVGTHVSGSAIDVSVYFLDGGEVDRGAPYIEVSEKTPMDSPFISKTAKKNRTEITAVMARHGFSTYAYEFWHYNQGDAHAEYLAHGGRSARYGPIDFDPQAGTIAPILNSTAALNSEEEIGAMIEKTLRGKGGRA